MTTQLDTELTEQPNAAAHLAASLPNHLPDLRALAGDCAGVTIVARGSSDNAARYGQYLIPLLSGLPVTLATPSLITVYDRRPSFDGQLVVAISQSGRSSDIVASFEAAREQGRPTVAITNDPASPLAAHATHVLDLGAGAERSVAATKTYTTSLIAVACLAQALSAPDRDADALAELQTLPGLLAESLTLAEPASRRTAQALHLATRAIAVGRGLNLSTAHETALKITELTSTMVLAFSPADLRHGPIGAVTDGVPVLLIAPDEAGTASVLELVPDLLARGADVHVLAAPASGGSSLSGVATTVPVAADVPSWLSPVVAAVPGQLVARALATLRRLDVDRPHGLSKVTDTR